MFYEVFERLKGPRYKIDPDPPNGKERGLILVANPRWADTIERRTTHAVFLNPVDAIEWAQRKVKHEYSDGGLRVEAFGGDWDQCSKCNGAGFWSQGRTDISCDQCKGKGYN